MTENRAYRDDGGSRSARARGPGAHRGGIRRRRGRDPRRGPRRRLALTWVLYERVLPFSGVLGFWLTWYVVFLLCYGVMAALQWDRQEAATG